MMGLDDDLPGGQQRPRNAPRRDSREDRGRSYPRNSGSEAGKPDTTTCMVYRPKGNGNYEKYRETMSRVEEALDTDQTEEEEDNGEYDVDKVARLDTIGKARDRPDNAHIFRLKLWNGEDPASQEVLPIAETTQPESPAIPYQHLFHSIQDPDQNYHHRGSTDDAS